MLPSPSSLEWRNLMTTIKKVRSQLRARQDEIEDLNNDAATKNVECDEMEQEVNHLRVEIQKVVAWVEEDEADKNEAEQEVSHVKIKAEELETRKRKVEEVSEATKKQAQEEEVASFDFESGAFESLTTLFDLMATDPNAAEAEEPAGGPGGDSSEATELRQRIYHDQVETDFLASEAADSAEAVATMETKHAALKETLDDCDTRKADLDQRVDDARESIDLSKRKLCQPYHVDDDDFMY